MASEREEDVIDEMNSDLEESDLEEEEGLLEPCFKYQRVEGPDMKQLQATQIITAITVHLKLIAIGTQQGYLWIMDHFGHVDHKHLPMTRPHRSAVIKLSMDSDGNYVMSCGSDGRVVISGLGCDNLNYVLNLSTVPRCIAISPLFSKSGSVPMFAVAERKLVIYERKFLKYRDTIIYSGQERNGDIMECSWQQSLIAFTNCGGTTIYDREVGKLISLIPPSHSGTGPANNFLQYPASHCWIDDALLAVAWADTLTIAKVVAEEGVKSVEIYFQWNLDMFCTGVSYAVRNSEEFPNMVVFGLRYGCELDANLPTSSSAPEENSSNPQVQLCLFEPKTFSSYSLLAEDGLTLSTGNLTPQPSHFTMAGLPTCECYFLAGPSDLITVTRYSTADRIRWRIENDLWEEAWELMCEKETDLGDFEWDRKSLGRAMIENFIASGKPRRAAARLAEVCGTMKTEWEWAVQTFEPAQLERECYETALLAALYNDVGLFKRLILDWSPSLYRAGYITGITLKRIQEIASSQSEPNSPLQNDEISLYQALAHLYLHERNYSSALKIYFTLKDPRIFSVIDNYQLFDQVNNYLPELLSINEDQAVRLFLGNEDKFSPSLVVAATAHQSKLQLAYLSQLLNKNEAAEYADLAIRLFADHDKEKLLPFLRKNENYKIHKALDICQQKNYVEETIFLLGKSGKYAEALDLLMKSYDRLEKALEFCQEQDDADLWTRLIDEVVKTPDRVNYLLNNAGSGLDPLQIIAKIPPTMPVPGLRDALIKVLRDYAVKFTLQKNCREATRADVRELLTLYLENQALSAYGQQVPNPQRAELLM
ncbi:unnamed protein product [Cylicostephanus goldi]|uniref:Vps41 beta-propeller domain-containing protein n=1 Tax=Cylicostephanus goldi TaxID=71465 RepID=A0A3P7PIY3_CYLGO|nr:unnamed protein product [Cylicostephanus goldi]